MEKTPHLNLVFFGKGQRGLQCLQALSARPHKISLVVSEKSDDPIAVFAKKIGMHFAAFADPNSESTLEKLRKEKADVFVLAGYGKILKSKTIAIPRLMCVNLHGGKLPEYRGSSPMNWALMRGEKSFTISVIQVDKGIDTGPILASETFPIGAETTIAHMHAFANESFPRLLADTLDSLAKNKLPIRPQPNAGAGYFPLRFAEDGLIIWDLMRAEEVHNRIRALTKPYPRAFTALGKTKIYLLASELCTSPYYGEASRVYRKTKKGILVCAQDQCLWITAAETESGEDALPLVERYAVFLGLRSSLMDESLERSMKIVAFNPYAAVWNFAFPMALIEESLQKSGHEILLLGCDKEYNSFCASMYYENMSHDSPMDKKERICGICIDRRKIIETNFPFESFLINDFITAEERLSAENRAASLDRNNFLKEEFTELPLVRFALIEVLIAFKKSDLNLNDNEFKRLQALYLGSLKTYFAFQRFLDQEKPDRVMMYNGLYAFERVASALAKAKKIPVYFMHTSANLAKQFEHLLIAQDDSYTFFVNARNLWQEKKSLPLSTSLLESVTSHYLELLKGQNPHVLSLPKGEDSTQIRQKFDIPENAKILLATMSSYDEVFAAEVSLAIPAEKKIFPMQSDWLKALIKYFSQHPDLFLIIRIHPREFQKDIFGRVSQHALEIQTTFKNLPPNVKLNTPEDKISLYDLANEVDVVLNAWSSAAEEFGLLGIPSVSYCDETLLYPVDLSYYADTEEKYFAALNLALQESWSLERIRSFFRWRALQMTQTVLDISQSFSHKNYKAEAQNRKKLLPRALRKLLRIFSPYYKEKIDCKRRVEKLPQADILAKLVEEGALTLAHLPEQWTSIIASQETETIALKKEIAKIYAAMYPNKKAAPKDGTLQARLFKAINA